MCKELEKEIKEALNLPRAERRKVERKLQKKYDDKSGSSDSLFKSNKR